MLRFLERAWKTIAGQLLLEGRRGALDWLSIRAVMLYVRGVGGARRMVVALVLAIAALLLASAGFILFHIGLFLWLPLSTAAKGLILAALGLAYLLIAALAIRKALSEKAWLRASGASDLIARVTGWDPPAR